MASVGEIAARLRAAVATLPTQRLQTRQHRLAEQAPAALQQLTASSRRAEPEQALALIQAAAAELGEAVGLLGTVANHVDAWIADGVASGPSAAIASGPAAAVTAVTTAGKPAPSAPAQAEAEPYVECLDDPRPLSEKAAQIIATLPKRTKTNRKTDGVWIDENEKAHARVWSGEEGKKETQEELRRLGIGDPRGELDIAKHVETQLAVRMRHSENVTEVSVFINNENGPCPDMWGCDRTLPLILRPGQRMIVYWPEGDTIRWKTFEGRRP